ncbi:MAG TPA: RND transporter [Desulfobulbus sp.]|nr:RND transporter [Desulfobulbus sp.]
MQLDRTLIQFPLNRPGLLITLMVLMTVALGTLIIRVHVDTGPENMLAKEEFGRIFHDRTTEEFNLHDVVILGMVNEKNGDGVFNPNSLKKIYALSKFAATLVDPNNPLRKVIARDIIAPDNVDTVEQDGPGRVKFQWLMKKPPATRTEALKIRDNALANPLLKGTMVSRDGRALAIYLPLSQKGFAHQVAGQLKKKIAELGPGEDQFYISGLPVAEDTFGKEMFNQMAISTPLSMLVIFILMLVFFKKTQLILSPIIIAACTVISTMGLLIGTGNTLHITGSLIPIFIIPIAVVNSTHILSEFFDGYQKTRDRRKTIEQVMRHLSKPMLFTSLTSSAGFASLALTSIPTVRTFGLFVAFGIMLAWLLAVLFIPAHIMLIQEDSLRNFGVKEQPDQGSDRALINRHLRWIGRTTISSPWRIIGVNLVIMAIGVIGILRIQVNDNPVKWFHRSHEIRIADRVLNDRFGGTYEAYLILSSNAPEMTATEAARWLSDTLERVLKESPVVREKVQSELAEAMAENGSSAEELFQRLSLSWQKEIDNLAPEDNAGYDDWSLALDALDQVRNRKQIFKRPDLLNYIIGLQKYLTKQGDVGKSNSISNVVQKVHQELFEGDPGHFTIPATINGVAQTLISYQNSQKPDELRHLVTPDYTRANLWLQLKSGDNRDMKRVIDDVNRYLADIPPPIELQAEWAGPAYINMVWQDTMVTGMLKSFLPGLAVVFIMMAVLFRSPAWGLLAMIPLTLTIGIIYGVIGLIGKDYNMPLAVLSLLTLGPAVDFAIHFLQRSRATMARVGDWNKSMQRVFEEPARAIARNMVVISIGFTPLIFAPLIPYQTAGVFLAAIMLSSGLATLWTLPALLTVMQKWIFKKERTETASCRTVGRSSTIQNK